jgi:hypothetical protein
MWSVKLTKGNEAQLYSKISCSTDPELGTPRAEAWEGPIPILLTFEADYPGVISGAWAQTPITGQYLAVIGHGMFPRL